MLLSRIFYDVEQGLSGVVMSEGKTPKRSTKSRRRSNTHQPVAPTDIGLPPPGAALTQPPEALRPRHNGSAMGSRSTRRNESAYVVRLDDAQPRHELASLEHRLEPLHARDICRRLVAVRAAVRRGSTILDNVADGTIPGWRARMAISRLCPAANLLLWDSEKWRTQMEREALIEKCLGLYGYVEPRRRGGWAVGR